MTIDKLKRALEILQPHYKYKDAHVIDFEHDYIYFSATDTPLSNAEVVEMYILGFIQPEINNTVKYDVEERWGGGG